MTDPTILAVITAIPPTLLALAAFVQSFKNNTLSEARSVATDAKIDQKANTMEKKTDEIHKLTNSNLSRVQADLAVALRRIDLLENHIAATPQEQFRPRIEGPRT